MIKGFYNYNEDYDFLNNIMVDGNSTNIYKYLHGYCHEFSIALNKKFGYPIALWIEYDCEIEENVLVHAFNIVKDTSKTYFIDVRGVTDDIKTLIGEFDYYSDIIINEFSLEDALKILKQMYIPVNNPSECKAVIENYINNYIIKD